MTLCKLYIFSNKPITVKRYEICRRIKFLFSSSFLTHAIMLDTLLCHVSTSQGSYHSSIAFLYLFVSIPICCCPSKMSRLWGNGWNVSAFFPCAQLWKAALLRQKEEETVDQEDPTSRPRQCWADAPAACDSTDLRKPLKWSWMFREEPESSWSVTSWPGLVTVTFTSILKILNIDLWKQTPEV